LAETDKEAAALPFPVNPLQASTWGVGMAQVESGIRLVTMVLTTFNSQALYFWVPEQAESLGKALLSQGRNAHIMNTAHKPKLHLPDGQVHVVEDKPNE